jgi:AraC-like DNA-binding protein
MHQRFEKKIQNLFDLTEYRQISFAELEEDTLYCVHLEVLGEPKGKMPLSLPNDSFLMSCYKSAGAHSYQTLFCSSSPNLPPCNAEHLKKGQHLILIGKFSWFSKSIQRFTEFKNRQVKSENVFLHYCDAQISKAMLIRQAELIFKERLKNPNIMDLHGFTVLMLSEWEGVQQLVSKVELGRDKWLVSQTKRLMEQHLEGQPLTLDLIAQNLAVSVSKLKIAFRREMGVSVYRHYLNLRLDRAKTLLITNHYNVSEVAYRIGYNSVSKFSKMFAEYHGALPSNYCKASLEIA